MINRTYIRSLKAVADENHRRYKETRLHAYLEIANVEIERAAYLGYPFATVYCPSDICNDFIEIITNNGFDIQRTAGNSYNHYNVKYTVEAENHEKEMLNKNEYRGIVWSNATDLSTKLGKARSYVAQYIRDGRSYEEIIDHVLDGKTFQND